MVLRAVDLNCLKQDGAVLSAGEWCGVNWCGLKWYGGEWRGVVWVWS